MSLGMASQRWSSRVPKRNSTPARYARGWRNGDLLRELVWSYTENENRTNQRQQRHLNLAGNRPAPAGNERAHHESAERSACVHARDEHAGAFICKGAAE